MEVTLDPVDVGRKEILRNLLEKYLYEFSQYEGTAPNELGLFGYDYLDCYWTEERRWAFFIRVNGKLAGFAMVNDFPEAPDVPTDYSMAEFFVLYAYRRQGVGNAAAKLVFDRLKGRWQLKRHPGNLPSVAFWDRTVAGYTGGDYRLAKGYPGTEYFDGTPGDVFFFDNSRR